MCRHYALSSYALTCALLRYADDRGTDCNHQGWRLEYRIHYWYNELSDWLYIEDNMT